MKGGDEMQRKTAKLLYTLVIVTLLFGLREWEYIKEAKKRQDIISGFTELDVYGQFPLSSIATGNRNIYAVDDFIQENRLTYAIYYQSDDPDGELSTYREYLVEQGYVEATPARKIRRFGCRLSGKGRFAKATFKDRDFFSRKRLHASVFRVLEEDKGKTREDKGRQEDRGTVSVW